MSLTEYKEQFLALKNQQSKIWNKINNGKVEIWKNRGSMCIYCRHMCLSLVSIGMRMKQLCERLNGNGGF